MSEVEGPGCKATAARGGQLCNVLVNYYVMCISASALKWPSESVTLPDIYGRWRIQ